MISEPLDLTEPQVAQDQMEQQVLQVLQAIQVLQALMEPLDQLVLTAPLVYKGPLEKQVQLDLMAQRVPLA